MLDELPAVTLPFLVEHRLERGELLDAAVGADGLVGGKLHRVALDLDFDGHDLLFEIALLDGGRRSLVAFDGQLVLVGPRDVPLLGDVLRRHAHVAIVERIAQRGDHHVDERRVVHPRTPAHRGREIRAAAHVLGAAGDRHVGIAEHDRVGGGDDRLQSAAAESVERERRRFDRQAALHARDAGQIVVVGVGVDHIAEDDVPDRRGFDVGPLHRFAHAKGREVAGRNVLQAAAISADGCPCAADYYDLACHENSSWTA